MKNIKTILRQTSKVLAALAAVMMLPVMATTLGGNSAKAEDAIMGHEVDFSVTLSPSLQVVIPAETISLDLVPKVGESVFASEELSISIATNNPTGYQLTLYTEENATDLTRTEADNYGNFPTIATLDKLEGGYTDDTFTVNRWGYKQDEANYNAFESGVELSSTTGPTNIETTTLTFGAKVDMQQQAGTYALALNFVAVSNVVPGVYTINFEGNGADGGSTASQQIEAGQSANLNMNGFTRTDYNFIGWNTEPDGNGTSYSDGALYTAALTADNTTVTLYAQWEIATVYMQNIVASQCTSTPLTVVDNRDNNEYVIQKLDDGKCWMMENLRLGSTGTMTLTPANTNITSNYTLPASGTANFDSTNGYTNAAINIASRDVTDANGSKYGTYYNYCAASAGTYCYASGSGTGNATSDICPKGWRLPTGGASGEFGQLMVAYNISSNAAGSTTLQQTLKFPLAGYFYNGSANAQASSGPYWSSTYSSGTAMYYLGSNASTVNPQLSNDRYGGFLVRCVMNKYMQDVTAADVAAMAEGETAIMVDRRDDNAYTVAKINGNLWMTQNLDLPGGTTLTSADSNVTSNYTLPASSTSGFSDGNTAYIYNSNSTTCGNGSPCYSYYSYVAATAGTNPSSGDATSDICPKGWRLPTEAEMRTMARSYTTDATMIASPFLGVYAGLYDNSSFDKGGSYGYYWSSSIASSSTNASYGLYFYSSRSGVSNLHKKYGFSVRCVAKS